MTIKAYRVFPDKLGIKLSTEHAQNNVLVDLMLKSPVTFISLNRNNNFKFLKQLQNLFLILPSFMYLFCGYFQLRLFHNCLSQNLEHIQIFEQDFLIVHDQVSSKGR